MTNKQQTVLDEVSGSEQPQEEIEFTELRPVEQSRIKISKNDKDPAATDGLKLLRSIIHDDDREDLNDGDKLFRKNNQHQEDILEIQIKLRSGRRAQWKPSMNENDDGDVCDDDKNDNEIWKETETKATRKYRKAKYTKRKSSEFSWSDIDKSNDSDEEFTIKKKAKKFDGRCKKQKQTKQKHKDPLKDEIYYYRQNLEQSSVEIEENDNMGGVANSVFQDMANNFLGASKSKNKFIESTKKIKKILTKEKYHISTKSNSEVDNSTATNKTEHDLKDKIDVIIQSNYYPEKDNNNVNGKDKNKSKKIFKSSIQSSQSATMNVENLTEATTSKSLKDQTTSTRDDEKELKKYCCLMCDAKFKGSGGLRNHWKVIHGTGPLFECNDCGKQFPLKERLKLHVRTHTGFKPYKCAECDKSFARGGQLAQHRRTHSHVKAFHCTLCPGTFTCAANLALHMKRHNNQKDHKCGICGREFIRRDALKKHLECLHRDVKSFLCIICNKTFKGHLPQHMRTHCQDRPHGCATCGQRFAQKSQLTVHQRTHSGQRPFRCLVCWQAFAHSTALKLHTRRHTGERPFKCNLCSAGFTQLPHWKKHMKCIHGRSKPYDCKNCNKHFKMKNDLDIHENSCIEPEPLVEEVVEDSVATPKEFEPNQFKTMNIEKMRLLLAVLLKRISKPEKLDELGFGKRLIDEILQDSLVSAGKIPVKSNKFGEHEALRKNLEMFLEWTVPKANWKTFKKLKKTPEEILETLTAT